MLLFFCVVCLLTVVSGNPIVEVQQGIIEGEVLKTVQEGKPYSSFRSIPYARPPVGPLRFQRPQPAGPWNGTLYANHDAPECMQSMDTQTVLGTEDCLYLNVYTPKTDFSSVDGDMAVMVLIHGGGFTIGSGNRGLYGPDFFMLEDVVLVTLNYRLGVLGFISFLSKELPGNMGLWDQVAALNWVKNNIAVFGGNSSNVMIFGESAGAASVHAHILSSVSQELFHKGLSESGTMVCPWAINRDPVERARKLAEEVGCLRTSMASMVECLQEASAEKMIITAMTTIVSMTNFESMDIFPFVPVIDANVTGILPFFTQWPEILMKAGDFKKVPYIAGINSNELLIIFSDSEGKFPLIFPQKEMAKLIMMVNMELRSQDLKPISGLEELVSLNETQQTMILNTLAMIIKSASNIVFRLPLVRTHDLQAAHNTAQFAYEYGFEGALDAIKQHVIEPIRKIPGVPHVQELFYLFSVEGVNITLPESDPAMITLKRMVRMWTNFAKYSNPTPDATDPLLNVVWDQYSVMEKRYLDINNELTVRCDLIVDGECVPSVSTQVTIVGGGKEEGFVFNAFSILWFVLAAITAVVSLLFAIKYLCIRRADGQSIYRKF